jgi:pyrimidine-nucleoside phosphorylase
MNCLPLIEAKREGKALSAEQIRSIIAGYTGGRIPDYQMAALLMAILFRGMDAAETRALTIALRDSGQRLQFPPDPRPLVDKHSTGGVGDKVSLVLAPLLACLGFRVPMISGRALGITGGTLDKLESIPGFRSALHAKHIIDQVQKIGCVICAQTDDMVPADKALYALRDATGTVPSIPLITASILSKKLAENLDCLLLDVKFGSAAFMQTEAQARELAATMVRLGNECGVKTRALLTDMHAPLGHSAGNWLEVREAVACLECQGPADLEQLVMECAAQLLVMSNAALDVAAARSRALEKLRSRAALDKWEQMIAAQGTDLKAYREKLRGDFPGITTEVNAQRNGFVQSCDARVIGEVVRDLGGGRMQKESQVNVDVGVDRIRRPGKSVRCGEVLGRVHTADLAGTRDACERVKTAFVIGEAKPEILPLVREVLQ